ncbi:helix-turn-helix domain-containing protein [Streptomyces phaeolivaceus]|uniref:Helix-turn-helix domain-containing protein n=1 Tax=Streptomyces phaeolivaceus TaxID=2653200 RepID=A0A5P8K8T0_9ACTN|nr:helix-turn-helix transcriptional regulator [Streptomyces phaeolivaceus]QFQ99645.1 helix-turn-helix domain-containing protein [Streptomyces phaeolivaceus]
MRRNAEGAGGASNAALFGEVLRHYREAALLTQEALARQIPCDRSQVAKIEAGTRVPSDQFAKRCDEVLETGGVLARIWAKVDWYPQVVYPDWFERRVQMDNEATSILQYLNNVVPGLMQTEEYMYELFKGAIGDTVSVEERVRARLSRQQRILSPDGPLYVAVLDESCLRRVVGSPSVMRNQLAHLLAVGRRPNIRVQVLPFDSPGVARPATPMTLIKLPDGHEWLYSESLDLGHFSDEPAILARHRRTYDVLRADTLSARESAALISDLMEGFDDGEQSGSERSSLDQEQPQRSQLRRLRRNRPRYPRTRPRP